MHRHASGDTHRSATPLSEMGFSHFARPFVLIFQLFGLSHYGLSRPDVTNHRLKLNLLRTYLIVHVVFHATIVYYSSAVGVTIRLHGMEDYHISTFCVIVNVWSRCSEILSFLLIPIETYFKRKSEQQIFETIECIDALLQQKMKYDVDNRMRCRRQLVRTWLWFVVSVAILTTSLSISVPLDMSNRSYGISVMLFTLFILRLRIFQTAFFINAVIGLLDDLKMAMQRQQQRFKYNIAGWRDIQYARKIYSKIWLLRILISECYGVSMIFFVTDSSAKLVTSAYWIFLNSQSVQSTVLDIRMCLRFYFSIRCVYLLYL